MGPGSLMGVECADSDGVVGEEFICLSVLDFIQRYFNTEARRHGVRGFYG
jgi:hypothetical protein